jgi:predicted small lipoprotein YifL
MKIIKSIITLAVVGIALSACGVKGDLYPAEPDQSEVRR